MTGQLELHEFYRMRIDLGAKASIFDLEPVAVYLLARYAKEGRARFDGGAAMEARLTKRERDLFLDWLRRNGLIRLLDNPGSHDDGRRGKGKGRRQEQYGKEGTKPGRKSVRRVAQPDWGATPLFRPDDEGL
jgi:hypothetical protein